MNFQFLIYTCARSLILQFVDDKKQPQHLERSLSSNHSASTPIGGDGQSISTHGTQSTKPEEEVDLSMPVVDIEGMYNTRNQA